MFNVIKNKKIVISHSDIWQDITNSFLLNLILEVSNYKSV